MTTNTFLVLVWFESLRPRDHRFPGAGRHPECTVIQAKQFARYLSFLFRNLFPLVCVWSSCVCGPSSTPLRHPLTLTIPPETVLHERHSRTWIFQHPSRVVGSHQHQWTNRCNLIVDIYSENTSDKRSRPERFLTQKKFLSQHSRETIPDTWWNGWDGVEMKACVVVL